VREGDLLLVGQGLVREDEHGVLVHAELDCIHFVAAQGAGDVDASHFADETRMNATDVDRHGAPPLVDVPAVRGTVTYAIFV
jgi:hypothetical protein